MNLRQHLPSPEFVEIDPSKIEQEHIALYEQMTQKTLYPAQIERLFINQIVYAETRLRAAIQHAGEQMLVRWSSYPIQDYLGDLVGCARLLAQPARCKLEIQSKSNNVIVIPALSKIRTQDGKHTFITDTQCIIARGQKVHVESTCTVPGIAANGLPINTITVTDLTEIDIKNITITAGGSERETDDAYAERIILAPESFTNAGSYGAYEYHVRSVHPSIVAVSVLGPDMDSNIEPGTVQIYPLTTSGLPDEVLLEQIRSEINSDKKRPLCDTVIVSSPLERVFSISAELRLNQNVDIESILANARFSLNNYLSDFNAQLGKDIVPSEISAALFVPGVYDVTILTPSELQIVERNEWARCQTIDIKLGISSND